MKDPQENTDQEFQINQKIMLMPPVSGQDHVPGPAAADITLVEYGDHNSTRCAAAQPWIKVLRSQMGDRLRYVFRHFPAPGLYPHAAEAAEAAGRQGRFWEMHEALFAHYLALGNGFLVEYASDLGLNTRQFLQDMTQDVSLDRVRRVRESGVQSGVVETPAFFVNGVRQHGSWEGQDSWGESLRWRMGLLASPNAFPETSVGQHSSFLDFSPWMRRAMPAELSPGGGTAHTDVPPKPFLNASCPNASCLEVGVMFDVCLPRDQVKHQRIGGDFADVVPLCEDSVTLFLGDACGQGTAAALAVPQTSHSLRRILSEYSDKSSGHSPGFQRDPAYVLQRLNRNLCGLALPASCASAALFLVVLNTKTGEAICTCAGAEPPLILRVRG